MSTYARLWCAAAVATMAVGLVAALLSRQYQTVAVAFAITSGLVAFVLWGRLDARACDVPSAIRAGTGSGFAVVASLGLGFWLGRPGLLLVLALAVSSPRAVHALTAHGSTSAAGTARDGPPDATSPTETFGPAQLGVDWTSTLTNRDLCDGWSASYLGLHTAGSNAERMRIVLIRQAYLDEFEKRNQPAFRRWLANEPRASNCPAKLLAAPPTAPVTDEEP